MARRNNFESSKPKLKNCVVCGKVFASVWGSNTCDRCRAKIAEREKAVIEYVMEHPNETIQIVAEECDVSVQFVRKMIESGRLTIKGENMSYPCNGCGKPIVAGQYCADCMARIQSQIEKAKEMIKQHWQEESGNAGKNSGKNSGKDKLHSKRDSRLGSDAVMTSKTPTLRETLMNSSTYKTMMGISDNDSSSKSSTRSSKSSKSARSSSSSTRQGRKIPMPAIPPVNSAVNGPTILEKIADSSTSIFSKFISGSKNKSGVK